jgi:leucyl aminopeptidase
MLIDSLGNPRLSPKTRGNCAQALTAGVAIIGRERSEANPAVAASVAGGVTLGLYEDQRFKSEAKPYSLREVEILGLGTAKELQRAIGVAQRLASGVILTKQLVNAPPNVLTPGKLQLQVEHHLMRVWCFRQVTCGPSPSGRSGGGVLNGYRTIGR